MTLCATAELALLEKLLVEERPCVTERSHKRSFCGKIKSCGKIRCEAEKLRTEKLWTEQCCVADRGPLFTSIRIRMRHLQHWSTDLHVSIVSLHNSRTSLRGSSFTLLCGSWFPRKCLSKRIRIRNVFGKRICKINEKMCLLLFLSWPFLFVYSFICAGPVTPPPPPHSVNYRNWQQSSRLSFSSRRTRP